MDSQVLEMAGELSAELARNSMLPIDPRTVPVRFSTLKQFAHSPAHYLHAVQRGYDETLSMRLGSGAHAILFGQPYTVWAGKVRNGKAWDAFEAEHSGELILNAKELAEAQAMADAIRRSEKACQVLFAPGTIHEQRIDWEWQGRAFRSTPDANSYRHLVDLKCLRSAEPDRVMWQSMKMAYHAQASLYRMALNSTGNMIRDAYLCVVENKAPYPVTVFRFTETALEQGEKSLALWMEQLRACEAANTYPGYCQAIVDLDVPQPELDLTFGEDEE